jgi:cell division protein FtsB
VKILKVRDEVLELTDGAGRDPELRRRAATLASILLLIALAVGSLFGDSGILHLLQERERVGALRRELEEVKAENGRLAEAIQALQSDPRSIERLAREELGLAAPGEIVFLVRDEPVDVR